MTGMDRREFLRLTGAMIVTPMLPRQTMIANAAPWYLVLDDGQEIGPLRIEEAAEVLTPSQAVKQSAGPQFGECDFYIDWIQVVGPISSPLSPETQVDGRVVWPDGRTGLIRRYS